MRQKNHRHAITVAEVGSNAIVYCPTFLLLLSFCWLKAIMWSMSSYQASYLPTEYPELPSRVRMLMSGVTDGVYLEWIDPESDLGWRYGLRVFDRVRPMTSDDRMLSALKRCW